MIPTCDVMNDLSPVTLEWAYTIINMFPDSTHHVRVARNDRILSSPTFYSLIVRLQGACGVRVIGT